ncbi:MAG: dihydroneopterin aldolase [Gammaproteobacteria bacterium]|nr:dihydroneopterin aldolase [Gammaproteobacteria bacterium]
MDIIFLNNLEVMTTIGIYSHEKTTTQPLVLDLELSIDLKKAGLTDDIKHTVDYSKLTAWLIDECKTKRFALIEALGEHICQQILATFAVSQIKLKISKINALSQTKNVGIIMTRTL